MKALDSAKWFVNELHPTTKKLQKLLYLAQGFSFAFNDQPLFDDDFEAWVHGPVIREVYNEFKKRYFNSDDKITDSFVVNDFTEDEKYILNYVKNEYGYYEGDYLESITHNQEPWMYARKGIDPCESSTEIIDKEDIANYFINFINQPGDGAECDG